MLIAVDVHYGDTAIRAALVGFAAWADASSAREVVETHPPDPAPYVPGAFFARELPYLSPLIEKALDPIDLIVVDGYVWLGPDRKGLGVHVHERFGVPVIGVAKTSFAGAPAQEVIRGASRNPLYVTAIGIAAHDAAAHIASMHGPFRIPTLLKRADFLARGHAAPA